MFFSFTISLLISSVSADWASINLHKSHIPYYFNNHPDLKSECLEDPNCPYKSVLNSTSCFGYEESCQSDDAFQTVSCPEPSKWSKSKEEQKRMFWDTGDFGIVKGKLAGMQTVCSSKASDGSHMECDGNARYCRGQKVVLDLRKTVAGKLYDVDFIKKGEIGGRCSVNKKVINGWNKEHRNSLQSWYQVMEHIAEFKDHKEADCDVRMERPVIISQTDAVSNMFHHFCDFVNVYVSQHLNGTSFPSDVQIITWDTHGGGYHDPFNLMWKMFSHHTPLSIGTFVGKKVCFKEVMFALPPRQRLGLFYNMPLIDGCYGSGLFRAFNDHAIHRLGVKQNGPLRDKVRITILSRQTKYRNILNEQELVDHLNRNPKYEAKIVTYKFVEESQRDENFMSQLTSTYNSDVFIGMHGAGLTHLLMLPHWAAIIELYHCGDPKCYETLARLRGVKYFTWTNMDKLYPEDEGHHPTLGAHEKFTNYSFDVSEFLKLVKRAADHVMKHPEFRAARRQVFQSSATRDEL
ncbi:EGF domain-specific O-linked N-acetylglucosamine transferase-like [Watersipora subatra]|uniref:EGF domain-specific O-linked N-acetylglucosamine transferase-like n=1 Tax=Watersipora subatra TaxID=2589382 RepID=UPI00355C3202